jgi:hypothetical protein
VGVRIDAARHDESAARIDDVGSCRSFQVLADGDDPFAVHQHIGASAQIGIHNGSAADEKGHDDLP